jgi:hypothetical protein
MTCLATRYTPVSARLILYPEDGGYKFLRNIGSHMDNTTLYFRRLQYSKNKFISQTPQANTNLRMWSMYVLV